MLTPIADSSNEIIYNAPMSKKRECIAGVILVLALGAIGAGVYFAVTGNLGLSAYVPMLVVGGITAATSTVALVILHKRRKTSEIVSQPLLHSSPPEATTEAAAEKDPDDSVVEQAIGNILIQTKITWNKDEKRYTAGPQQDLTIRAPMGQTKYVWDDKNLRYMER